MRFLDYKNNRYIHYADLINWLSEFALALEEGDYEGHGPKEGQLVWNIVAALMLEDLKNKPQKRSE